MIVPEDYKNYFRMSDENLKYLLAKVKPSASGIFPLVNYMS
jgi:hypothetical protein